MNDPGLLRMEAAPERLAQEPVRQGEGSFGLLTRLADDDEVVRPPRQPIAGLGHGTIERREEDVRPSSPIRFPGSPEGWWGDEALQAEAQAPQAPREQRHQAAGNIPALRSRGLFSAGVRFATASHMPVDTAQWRASDSTSTSRSSRSVRAM